METTWFKNYIAYWFDSLFYEKQKFIKKENVLIKNNSFEFNRVKEL